MRGAFQTHRLTALGKRLEVAAGPAAKVQYGERRVTLDALQQCSDVLLDVMVARALPERLGAPVVVIQRATGDASRSCGLSFISDPGRVLVIIAAHSPD